MTDSEYNEYIQKVKMAVDIDNKEVLKRIYDDIRSKYGECEELSRLDRFYNTKWSGMV